jgi:hypothetical protein
MALKEYAGAIVMEVDGQEIEIESFSPTFKSGRRPVKTMNRTGRIAGFSQGIEEHDLRMTAVVPLEGDIEWSAITGAKVVIFPITEGGRREVFYDVFVTDVGESYKVDGEAMRDVSAVAVRRGFE